VHTLRQLVGAGLAEGADNAHIAGVDLTAASADQREQHHGQN
jgi:hypothetical protein